MNEPHSDVSSISEDTNGRWLCCQIGAREHYAIPRGLLACGCDVQLLTDFWAADRFRVFMPRRWRQRFHSDLSPGVVTAWNSSALGLQLKLAACQIPFWDRILATDSWFQRNAANHIARVTVVAGDVPVVFAYSYAAKGVFEAAKRLGCMTILGQIDPGPSEMRIVQELHAKHGVCRCQWPPQSYWDQWQQECELADAIVVNSDWSRQSLISEGIDEARIHVIPLAYERNGKTGQADGDVPSEFSRRRPLRILFLGQVNLRKGIKELIAAIRFMHGEHVEWTIVGDGDCQLLAELRSLPQVSVSGPVSREEVSRFYAKADAFILPTHSDGYAITQLEAASHGLPIIASLMCGRVVVDGENGLLLAGVSGHEIAKSVRVLLAQPALLKQMRRSQQNIARVTVAQLGSQFVRLSNSIRNRQV